MKRHVKSKHFAMALLVCLLALFPGSALAVDVAGVRFPESATIAGKLLRLNGVGIRRATVFQVKVYVAALYVGERTQDGADVLRTDRSKYYIAVMKRDVSRGDSAPAFRENIERSAGPDADAIRSEIVAFEKWIPAMREGQQLTASFTPGVGVVVRSTAREDAFRGSVPFGTALFGIWIGPRAANAELRQSLLRGQPSAGS